MTIDLNPDRLVTVTLPLSHWQQIQSDIENMCGVGAEEIEILSSAVMVDREYIDPSAS